MAAEDWSRRLLSVGDRLAGYQVESLVARGGMAVVYRARDLRLDRTVALKVIAPELASHDKFRQRFMRESELAASMDHPNIIPIYAAGEADQLLYLVMRFVAGQDLGSVLGERGALPPREALAVFTQVAGALDAAHARQLVHRDVKPGNILLSGDEDIAQRHIYLSDFGLTKRLSSLTGITTTGHFLGTIQYVAPEQVANRPGRQPNRHLLLRLCHLRSPRRRTSVRARRRRRAPVGTHQPVATAHLRPPRWPTPDAGPHHGEGSLQTSRGAAPELPGAGGRTARGVPAVVRRAYADRSARACWLSSQDPVTTPDRRSSERATDRASGQGTGQGHRSSHRSGPRASRGPAGRASHRPSDRASRGSA